MIYAFMIGALIVGLAVGALAWEMLVAEPLRRRLVIFQRLYRR